MTLSAPARPKSRRAVSIKAFVGDGSRSNCFIASFVLGSSMVTKYLMPSAPRRAGWTEGPTRRAPNLTRPRLAWPSGKAGVSPAGVLHEAHGRARVLVAQDGGTRGRPCVPSCCPARGLRAPQQRRPLAWLSWVVGARGSHGRTGQSAVLHEAHPRARHWSQKYKAKKSGSVKPLFPLRKGNHRLLEPPPYTPT